MSEINIPIEKLINGEVVVVETKTLPIAIQGEAVTESVTENYFEDPLDDQMQDGVYDLPQTNTVILPIFMKQGDARVQLGDLVFDPQACVGSAAFNTPAGRDISELIGSGVLAGITFGAMVQANSVTNKLN
jgi:hypothetical protein